MNARLWLHALRAARRRQLVGRLTRPARRRRFPPAPEGSLRPLVENEGLWRSRAFEPLSATPECGTRLAAFQASYGEDVLELARSGGAAAAAASAWIDGHPPRNDDAWHPYVASTRAANWLAAATLDPAVRHTAADSIRRALARVSANIEDDILGNHVIRNAKALVLGGVAFDDAMLRDRGRALLRRELPEQVLADGGHYERSPAYHRLVLRDLLEVRLYADVEAEIARMTAFAAASSRPDGAPWLFNDGGLDIAPLLELPAPEDGIAVFEETGYVFACRGELALAFDCGPPSPPFLPAHAHADALSFQLWWQGRPVVVDPGMPTYDAGAERDFFRSTPAHSTVSVDGSQFELWGAFRAGRLPAVELVEASERRLVGRLKDARGFEHVRRIELDGAALVVADEIRTGSERSIASTLVLAVGAPVDVTAPGEIMREARQVAERFGDRSDAEALIQTGAASTSWRLRL